MRSNGQPDAHGDGVARTGETLSHVTWKTETAIVLPIGALRASGDVSPQVRSPQRLAEVGELDAQIGHIRRVIVDALAGALAGMEPSVEDVRTRKDELASLTLVSANMRLGAAGVALLDLRIDQIDLI